MKRPIRVARELPTPQCISLMLWQLGAKQQNIHIQQRLSLCFPPVFLFILSPLLFLTLSLSLPLLQSTSYYPSLPFLPCP